MINFVNAVGGAILHALICSWNGHDMRRDGWGPHSCIRCCARLEHEEMGRG